MDYQNQQKDHTHLRLYIKTLVVVHGKRQDLFIDTKWWILCSTSLSNTRTKPGNYLQVHDIQNRSNVNSYSVINTWSCQQPILFIDLLSLIIIKGRSIP